MLVTLMSCFLLEPRAQFATLKDPITRSHTADFFLQLCIWHLSPCVTPSDTRSRPGHLRPAHNRNHVKGVHVCCVKQSRRPQRTGACMHEDRRRFCLLLPCRPCKLLVFLCLGRTRRHSAARRRRSNKHAKVNRRLSGKSGSTPHFRPTPRQRSRARSPHLKGLATRGQKADLKWLLRFYP